MKQTQIDIYSLLLTLYEEVLENFFAQFVAMDESWIYHYNVETKRKSNGHIVSHSH